MRLLRQYRHSQNERHINEPKIEAQIIFDEKNSFFSVTVVKRQMESYFFLFFNTLR